MRVHLFVNEEKCMCSTHRHQGTFEGYRNQFILYLLEGLTRPIKTNAIAMSYLSFCCCVTVAGHQLPIIMRIILYTVNQKTLTKES